MYADGLFDDAKQRCLSVCLSRSVVPEFVVHMYFGRASLWEAISASQFVFWSAHGISSLSGGVCKICMKLKLKPT